jgi:hypothetical protein
MLGENGKQKWKRKTRYYIHHIKDKVENNINQVLVMKHGHQT